MGRQEVEIDPLDRRTTYAYDDVGNLTLKRDARDQRITMVYDAVQQLVGRRYPGGERHTFAYDAVGNRLLMDDPTGRTSYTYDARYALLTATNPDDKRVTYAYDGLNRRRTMTDPDDGLFTYTHDAAGRLTSLVNPQDERSTFIYDALDRQIQKKLANGNLTTQIYDDAGRLTGLVNAESDGTPISRFTYTYDNVGNRTNVVEADSDRTTWTYDRTYQLTREHRTGNVAFDVTYTYDGVGNRLVQEEDPSELTTYTYDAANELLTEKLDAVITTYSYDACGNRTQKDDDGSVTDYTWDEDNRLRQAELPAGADPVTLTYNAAGQRVAKQTAPADSKKFIYDFNNLLQETDGDTNETEMLYTSTTEEYGDLVSEYSQESRYHQYDALGSTDALVNQEEEALESYKYRAFGTVASGDATATPFTFVGKQNYYHDTELDLYLLGAATGGRYYDAQLGRFISQDLIGYDAGDMNLYGYVSARPVSIVDPYGLEMIGPGYPRTPIPRIQPPPFNDHHWFPRSLDGLLGKVCNEAFRLLAKNSAKFPDDLDVFRFSDMFTTRIEGVFKVGSPHEWIHYGDPHGKYIDQIKKIYNKHNRDGSCCDLLKEMRGQMAETYYDAREAFPKHKILRKLHPWGEPALDTTDLLDVAIDFICNPPCVKPNAPAPAPNMVDNPGFEIPYEPFIYTAPFLAPRLFPSPSVFDIPRSAR